MSSRPPWAWESDPDLRHRLLLECLDIADGHGPAPTRAHVSVCVDWGLQESHGRRRLRARLMSAAVSEKLTPPRGKEPT